MSSILPNPRKRIRIDDMQFEIPIYKLPISLLGHITTFSTIEDYAFSILLVSKHFQHHLSPYKSPHIVKQLIQNECYTIIKDINPFMDTTPDENNISPWRDWILSASYAWNNQARIPRIQHRYIKTEFYPKLILFPQDKRKSWINDARKDYNFKENVWNNYPTGDDNNSFEKDKQNAISSALYFLHFLHKVRFGGFDRWNDITTLIEKLLFSFGGALGLRYMIWFMMKEIIYDPLKSKGKDAIMDRERYKTVFDTLLDTLMNYTLVVDLHHTNYRQDWYIEQVFGDFDKILSKYVDILKDLRVPDFFKFIGKSAGIHNIFYA